MDSLDSDDVQVEIFVVFRWSIYDVAGVELSCVMTIVTT